MNSIKIVQKFFNITDAKSEASWQRSKAKKERRLISKIEIVNAYELFKTNGWFRNNPFKKLGIPVPDQFMVIVHYTINSPIVESQKQVETVVKSAKLVNSIQFLFQIVKLPLTIPYFFWKPVVKTIRLSCQFPKLIKAA